MLSLRKLPRFAICLLLASCGIDPVVVEEGAESLQQSSYIEQTAPFGFQISVPSDLGQVGWAVKDPLFLAGQASDGFQQLVLRRVFGLQVDAPPGGDHLLTNNNEFGANPRATRLVVYVYERPSGMTIEAISDSVRGVAYDAFDDRINGQEAKTIVYKGPQGSQGPGRPRNASESLIPQHIVEGSRYLYFILYWDREPDVLRNVLRIVDTFRIFDPI